MTGAGARFSGYPSNSCPSSIESTYTGTWPADWHHQAFPLPAHSEIQLKQDDLLTVLCLLQPRAVNCHRKCGHTDNLCPTKKVKSGSSFPTGWPST